MQRTRIIRKVRCPVSNRSGRWCGNQGQFQCYTLNPSAIATAQMLCEEAGAPYKKNMIRSDIPGGSTIDPMLSSLVPMHTIDIIVLIPAMHSACEVMQMSDEEALFRVMKQFYAFD